MRGERKNTFTRTDRKRKAIAFLCKLCMSHDEKEDRIEREGPFSIWIPWLILSFSFRFSSSTGLLSLSSGGKSRKELHSLLSRTVQRGRLFSLFSFSPLHPHPNTLISLPSPSIVSLVSHTIDIYISDSIFSLSFHFSSFLSQRHTLYVSVCRCVWVWGNEANEGIILSFCRNEWLIENSNPIFLPLFPRTRVRSESHIREREHVQGTFSVRIFFSYSLSDHIVCVRVNQCKGILSEWRWIRDPTVKWRVLLLCSFSSASFCFGVTFPPLCVCRVHHRIIASYDFCIGMRESNRGRGWWSYENERETFFCHVVWVTLRTFTVVETSSSSLI